MVTIFLLLLVFVSFELYSFIYEKNVIQKRVSTMDNFLFSVEENLERQMYIIGFRIIFLAGNKVTSTGNYIDVDSFFNESFFNGTVNGEEEEILIGVTYDDLIDSLNEKASKLNVNITLKDSYIEISQSSPWYINFSLISDFTMSDKADLAKWEKQQIVSALIPVENFEDPVYTVNSYAKISRKITRTPYEGNYVSGSDVSNLYAHVDGGYYADNENAPSFLNRLEGNLSADVNGIESFVNIPELSAQGIPPLTKTTIDYFYFSSDNPTHYAVAGMPSWFRIDEQDNHFEKYGVESLII